MEWIVLCQPHYYCFFFAYCKLVTGMFNWSFLAVGLRGIFIFYFLGLDLMFIVLI